MIKLMIVLAAFSLAFGFVMAQDSWEDFSEGQEDGFVDNSSSDLISPRSDGSEGSDNQGYFNSNLERRFTVNFYMALGVAIIGVAIVFYLAWALLKRPRNRWDSGRKRQFLH